MPKRLTDKDRLLAFAFRANAEELTDAISVLRAALAAKSSTGPRQRKPAKAASVGSINKSLADSSTSKE